LDVFWRLLGRLPSIWTRHLGHLGATSALSAVQAPIQARTEGGLRRGAEVWSLLVGLGAWLNGFRDRGLDAFEIAHQILAEKIQPKFGPNPNNQIPDHFHEPRDLTQIPLGLLGV
jgi:hypothetical protein